MDNQILYLSHSDVQAVQLGMRSIIDLLELAFIDKGKGNVELPPKLGIHTKPDAFVHAMPAYIPSLGSAGIKWVSGYPENPHQGLPYINGLIVLNDPETGLPLSVMDCTWITAMRTGAATAISAKYLARSDSCKVGIIACGIQGRANLEAIACLFPITTVYAYDINIDARDKFLDEIRSQYSFNSVAVNSPKDAVIGSDIVVTSGPIQKTPHPTIERDWLPLGAFGSAVDYDSYWTGAALAQMDRISTDDLVQFQQHKGLGYFQQTPEPYADLGELAAQTKLGRQSDQERTLAMNLGLAMDDMAIAPEIYRRAKEKCLGTWLNL